MGLWYSLEVPCRGASNEYPQHMFTLRNKKNNMDFPSYLELCWDIFWLSIKSYGRSLNSHSSWLDVFFFSPKVLIFFLLLHENICCGYSLKALRWSASNEYPEHMFCWRNKKNIYMIPFLSRPMLVLINNSNDHPQQMFSLKSYPVCGKC